MIPDWPLTVNEVTVGCDATYPYAARLYFVYAGTAYAVNGWALSDPADYKDPQGTLWKPAADGSGPAITPIQDAARALCPPTP